MFHGTKKNLNIYVGISPLTSSNFNSIYAYFCFPNGIITWFCEFQHSFRLLERFITQRIYEIEWITCYYENKTISLQLAVV